MEECKAQQLEAVGASACSDIEATGDMLVWPQLQFGGGSVRLAMCFQSLNCMHVGLKRLVCIVSACLASMFLSCHHSGNTMHGMPLTKPIAGLAVCECLVIAPRLREAHHILP